MVKNEGNLWKKRERKKERRKKRRKKRKRERKKARKKEKKEKIDIRELLNKNGRKHRNQKWE